MSLRSLYWIIGSVTCVLALSACDSRGSSAEISLVLGQAFSADHLPPPDEVTPKAFAFAHLRHITEISTADCPQDFQRQFELWVDAYIQYVKAIGTESEQSAAADVINVAGPALSKVCARYGLQLSDWQLAMLESLEDPD